MRLERVTDAGHGMYATALELYRESFPYYERREEDAQRRILGDGAYWFCLAYDGDTFVGLVLYWETEEFLFVEHLCILPELRNRAYGQKILAILGQYGKTVILEIDPPEDEISIRRRGFYQRCGFVENPHPHEQLPFHREDTAHPLVIMSAPRVLTREEYDRFNRYVRERVMVHLF